MLALTIGKGGRVPAAVALALEKSHAAAAAGGRGFGDGTVTIVDRCASPLVAGFAKDASNEQQERGKGDGSPSTPCKSKGVSTDRRAARVGIVEAVAGFHEDSTEICQ